MNTVIGATIPPNKRLEYWHAMQVFRAGAIQLKNNPDTKQIAIDDQERYNRFLSNYVREPELEASMH